VSSLRRITFSGYLIEDTAPCLLW